MTAARNGFREPRWAELTFHEDRVIKVQERGGALLEIAKTRQAEEVSGRCGLFKVPRILDTDVETGTIVYENVGPLPQVSEVLAGRGESGPLLERIGRSLAAIHREMGLPRELKSPFEKLPADGSMPEAVLHGDFSVINMLFDRSADDLYILDWNTAFWLGEGTCGPPFIDLACLAQSLFIRKILERVKIGDPEQKAETFLRGYRAESDRSLDAGEFGDLSRKVFALYRRGWGQCIGKWHYMRYLPSFRRYLNFTERMQGPAEGTGQPG